MGFKFEPCPWCNEHKVKLFKSAVGSCYVQCQNIRCQAKLVTDMGGMMDTVKAWNYRAQRRALVGVHDMNAVTMLYADIYDNPDNQEFVYLDNTDENWSLVFAAETICKEIENKEQPDKTEHEFIRVRYDVIMDYLELLVDEVADR